MHNTIAIRYGELALKGKNRKDFEKCLGKNIKDCLKKNRITFKKITRKRGRIYVDTKEECPELSHVFGIASYSYAIKEKFCIENIKKSLQKILANEKFDAFRISSKRCDKSVVASSQKLNIILGQFVMETFHKKVSMKEYDLDIGLELFEGNSYLFIRKFLGAQGLPHGSNGKALALIDSRKSVYAAWMLMKRGVRVFPAAVKNTDISLLDRYNYGYKPIHLYIIKNKEELKGLADEMGIEAVVLGQTLEEFEEIETKLLMLRPLIGFDKKTINKKLKDLYTKEI